MGADVRPRPPRRAGRARPQPDHLQQPGRRAGPRARGAGRVPGPDRGPRVRRRRVVPGRGRPGGPGPLRRRPAGRPDAGRHRGGLRPRRAEPAAAVARRGGDGLHLRTLADALRPPGRHAVRAGPLLRRPTRSGCSPGAAGPATSCCTGCSQLRGAAAVEAQIESAAMAPADEPDAAGLGDPADFWGSPGGPRGRCRRERRPGAGRCAPGRPAGPARPAAADRRRPARHRAAPAGLPGSAGR